MALGLIAGYLLCLLFSATAVGRPHMVARFREGQTPQQRERVLERNERHLAYVARFGRGRPQRTHALALRWVRAELVDVRALLSIVPYPWGPIAECESGRTPPAWGIVTGNGYVFGLQFTYGTWDSHRGGLPTAESYVATGARPSPREQVRVAMRVLAEQGWAAWPTCSRIVGLR